MKIFLSTIVFVTFFTNQVYAIEMWHADSAFAGQGMCAAKFTFDSGGLDTIQNLRVSVTAYNAGKKIDSGILKVNEFGNCDACRYAEAFLESEAMCNDNISIIVTKAIAIVNGKNTDLLKSNQFSIRAFKPFQVKIQK